jgi:DNA (cytosine-5)-methyltransferase 1
MVFPDTVESGKKNVAYNILRNRYKVVGNAVPPPMFEAVARALPDIW